MKTASPHLLRLAAIEREQRRMADLLERLETQFGQMMKLAADNAVLASMNRRLIGEKEKLLESLEIIKQARKA